MTKSSLRGKLTLALLVTGLTAAALVGLIARSILLNQFTAGLRENSFRMFQADIVAYVSKYGSWDRAIQAEPFGEFQRARLVPGSGPRRLGAPSPPSPRPGGRRGGPPPAPREGDPNAPPFRFLLLDPGGRVLMGPEEFPPRQPASEALRRQGRPIRVNGAVVAYAVSLDQPNLTDTDRQYLDAMQNAVTYGVLGAAFLALLLGFFFSGRLSRNLRRLTTAIQAMRKGDLHQHVAISSRDEIGFLADEFNRMSEELSKAHRALQESHDKIREQALRLEELSVRDELTQLHNRRYFNVQTALAFAQAVRADVRTDQKTKFQLGGALGRVLTMFGGKGAREGIRNGLHPSHREPAGASGVLVVAEREDPDAGRGSPQHEPEPGDRDDVEEAPRSSGVGECVRVAGRDRAAWLREDLDREALKDREGGERHEDRLQAREGDEHPVHGAADRPEEENDC